MKQTLGLNRLALWEAMDRKRKRLGLSWRKVAAAIIVAPSTLTRFGVGYGPDADAVMRMLAWVGHPLGKYARREGG